MSRVIRTAHSVAIAFVFTIVAIRLAVALKVIGVGATVVANER